jgi:predicted TIM-barrel fold metal-dependent hydrolase
MSTIDTNVYLGRWPFRRLPCDETPRLLERLDRHGITQAWVGSLEGVLHRDLGGVNLRLASECRQHAGRLVPFGSVNPRLPDWQEDVRRCADQWHMPGIRLHPNYHGYNLADPVFAEVLEAAEQRGLIVQLAARMDDPRVQHPVFPVANVELAPLATVLRRFPRLRLMVLNGAEQPRNEALRQLVSAGRVWFDLATLDGLGCVERLLKSVPPTQVVIGSHLPLFALESAVLKLKESSLPSEQETAIRHGNAQRLLPATARGNTRMPRP